MKILANFQISDSLAKTTGLDVIPLYPYKRLDEPVSAHADMLFAIIKDTIFCYKDYLDDYPILKEAIASSNYRLSYADIACAREYPQDIGLNVLVMGNHIFCNQEFTAGNLLEYAKGLNYKIVNVKQGYSACSTLVLNDNTAITTDVGIKKAIEGVGKKALLIPSDDIHLPPYSCGFIGGASGKIGNAVYVFGNLDTLKHADEIRAMIQASGCTPFEIPLGRVYDFGGIKVI